MATHQEIAQLLVSSWTLADPDRQRMPVANGLLDKALWAAVHDGLLPEWASSSLHFSDTRVGLRCVELPDILEWAQLAELTSSPNPSYRYAEIQVDLKTARRIIGWLEVDEAQARLLGSRIQQVIEGEPSINAHEFSGATV